MIRRLLWVLSILGAAAGAGAVLFRKGGGGLAWPGGGRGPAPMPEPAPEDAEVPERGSEQARVLPGPGLRPPKQGAVRHAEPPREAAGGSRRGAVEAEPARVAGAPAGGASSAAETAAAEPEPEQCVASTRNGERCSRQADPDSRFCWQHREG